MRTHETCWSLFIGWERIFLSFSRHIQWAFPSKAPVDKFLKVIMCWKAEDDLCRRLVQRGPYSSSQQEIVRLIVMAKAAHDANQEHSARMKYAMYYDQEVKPLSWDTFVGSSFFNHLPKDPQSFGGFWRICFLHFTRNTHKLLIKLEFLASLCFSSCPPRRGGPPSFLRYFEKMKPATTWGVPSKPLRVQVPPLLRGLSPQKTPKAPSKEVDP